MGQPWIGVDLDGTLAKWGDGSTIQTVGEPIQPMVDRVKKWLDDGLNVKILTARACEPPIFAYQQKIISEWCIKHLGRSLEITASKDFWIVALYDDKAKEVICNEGIVVGEKA